jgi:hypothetical protein
VEEAKVVTIQRMFTQRKPTQRALVGLALIGVSIAGTAVTIAMNNDGTSAVIATRVITAGSVITVDDVHEVLVSPLPAVGAVYQADVVGHTATVDIVTGTTIVDAYLDSTFIETSVLSVPLAIPPAESVVPGLRVQLWSMSSDGIGPVRLVARDAIVVASRSSGFGGEVMMDISLSFREVHTVLSAIGANSRIVATTGLDG